VHLYEATILGQRAHLSRCDGSPGAHTLVVDLSAAQEKVERDFLRKRLAPIASAVLLRETQLVDSVVRAASGGDVVVVLRTFA
jgi:hypothetical protein